MQYLCNRILLINKEFSHYYLFNIFNVSIITGIIYCGSKKKPELLTILEYNTHLLALTKRNNNKKMK